MKKTEQTIVRAVWFSRFLNRPYAVFRSLKLQVNIAVLTVPMLAYANADSTVAHPEYYTDANDRTYALQEIEISGSRVPMFESIAARKVTVLDSAAITSVPVQSVNDLLKYVAGVDVRQRGAFGVQTDISIRGGTYDQIAVMLNGINISDPQTGHNAADFPVSIHEIERIEVIEGPAGRSSGISSLVGAINIVTKPGKHNGGEIYADGGSYGSFGGGASIDFVTKKGFGNRVSGGYTRSDGYSRSQTGQLNSDYRMARGFYEGTYRSEAADVRWHFGMTNKDFGANTFYSAAYDNQYEHTRKYFTALQASVRMGSYEFRPVVYWNRSEDRFELVRNQPEIVPYNYHRTDVFGLNLGNSLRWRLGKTAFGTEIRNEGIVSTTLGEPLDKPKPHSGGGNYTLGLNRTNISFYMEHNVVWRGLTVSAGVITVKNTGNEMNFRFYPGVDASYRFGNGLKLYASYNTSLRMATFTELYYSTGGYKADKYLKPEEMAAYEVGARLQRRGFDLSLSIYHHHGTNMIDWIKDLSQGPDAPWLSVNHTKVNSLGVEAMALVNFADLLGRQSVLNNMSAAYNYMTQDISTSHTMQSQFALEYLRHKVVVQANFNLWRLLQLNVSYSWLDRMGNYERSGVMKPYEPYSLLDARLSWSAPNYKVYVEANNLFDKEYYDYGNIPQPGIWIRGGVSWNFSF